MDPTVPRKRGRPRKRPLPEAESAVPDEVNVPGSRKRVMNTRSMALVGRYLLKEFDGSGTYLGKVVYYDSGLYRIRYEDGDQEDLESGELWGLLVEDGGFTVDLCRRRKKLDKLISDESSKPAVLPEKNQEVSFEASSLSELSNVPVNEENGDQADADVDADDDSSTDSCECAGDGKSGLEADAPQIPPAPELPPSSGSIGIPEEYVSHLLSVYGLLRSFSIALYLCPFALDEFVGALNCPLPNTLLDAIHVALMRALRRHLESLSSEGSELASKCLSGIDWSLLDTLTWPIYVLHYLTMMGHVKGHGWKDFPQGILDRDYYSLSVGMKLLILQVLCDDALDCADVRAEMDIREGSEIGIDSDGVMVNRSENGPKMVHPRYCKTSACKNNEDAGALSVCYEVKSQSNLNCTVYGLESGQFVANGASLSRDGNGDECRLCGMDGTLLCCDGCPSAYHSRCIGVVKIPDGLWYCPECMIDKIGPSITLGTTLVGAKIFGTDPYEQVFLGTCNHLLVLKVSVSDKSCFRYYNQKDILKVLQALNSSVQHMAFYLEICKEIVKYWDLPDYMFSIPEIIETQRRQIYENDTYVSSQLVVSSGEEGQKMSDATGLVNVNDVSGGALVSIGMSAGQTSMYRTVHIDIAGQVSEREFNKLKDDPPLKAKLLEQVNVDSASSACSVTQQADASDVTRQMPLERSSAIDYMICSSRNSSGSSNGHPGGMGLTSVKSSHNKHLYSAGGGRTAHFGADDSVYSGTNFKPQAYINLYMHGYVAATAAANLATISAEEGQIVDAHVSGSSKKITSAGSQQMKAFISATSRFFWPSSERKLWEVPRDRCGWCYTCKASALSRRGCMLNSAASLTIKSAVKILSGIPLVKRGEGNLACIATYVLLIEESFRGLIGGPFLGGDRRKEWRELVQEATDCTAIKTLLLELEEHIRPIALSGDWSKLVDDYSIESSVILGVSSTVDMAPKRGPGGRRRKNAATSEVTADDCVSKSFSWWRGGKLSKLLLHKSILPRSMVKRAGRKGGVKKIPGLHYQYGSEIPRRIRQLAWRAAVEMCKTASQLALQVRYLDHYLRWSDLVRPEQIPLDAKGSELESSAFRNALICDKKVSEHKVLYCVDFGSQKHLSSRIMKSIIDIEQSGGKEKHWFSEANIPLYLIKEYEERISMLPLCSDKTHFYRFQQMQRMLLKSACIDIFSYLIFRRDNVDKFSCGSCRQNVPLRNAVKCSLCQGYCHQGCIARARTLGNRFCCKQCSNKNVFSRKENTESPTSPLLLQNRDCHTNGTVVRLPRVKGYNQPLASTGTRDNHQAITNVSSGSISTAKTRTRPTNWGIIWRKKNGDDTGTEFRLNNILLRGDADLRWSGPACHLCGQPYNSDLMYIRCQTCTNWYHADAVELTESRLFDVLGFKCCKCRRIKSPECPYDDKNKKRAVKKQQSSGVKQELDSDLVNISQLKEWEPTSPMFTLEEMLIQDEDPLLQSTSTVQQIGEDNWEVEFEHVAAPVPALQKLPVRRHVKRDGVADDLVENNYSHSELATPMEMNIPVNQTEGVSSPAAWAISGNGLDGDDLFDYESLNYEDMEFEPQTYFSFTELLASDEGGQFDMADANEVLSVKWEDVSSAIVPGGVAEQHGVAPSENGLGHAISESPAVAVNCRICLQSDPTPDLSCQVCGSCVHSQCSPQAEIESGEGSWKCRDCQDWR